MATISDEAVEAALDAFLKAFSQEAGTKDIARWDWIKAALEAAYPHITPHGIGVKEWRCFHCDQVFTDRIAAEGHFGKSADLDPVCLSSFKKMRERVLSEIRGSGA